MNKSKRARPDAPPAPLLKKSDALWLVAIISLALTAYELWIPDANVSNAQIIGLAIALCAIAMSSRYLSKHSRGKRAK